MLELCVEEESSVEGDISRPKAEEHMQMRVTFGVVRAHRSQARPLGTP